MKRRAAAARTVAAYIAAAPAPSRAALRVVRSAIRRAVPGGAEAISYGIPLHKLNGRGVIQYAGYARHVGLYPGKAALGAFANRLRGYTLGRGTVQFPLDRPMPVRLIAAITRVRAKAVLRLLAGTPRRTSAGVSGVS